MTHIEDVPRRYARKVMKHHSQLQSEERIIGRWPFRKPVILIHCNCGWKSDKEIPGVGYAEMLMVTNYFARLEMDKHVIDEAIKLGWKPRQRRF